MAKKLDDYLEKLPALRERLAATRELLLANAVMFSEIPAQTFEEAERARFMMDRLIEAGCQNVSTDEIGNAAGIHPGTEGKRNILLAAHMDTPFAASVDHAVQVSPTTITGPSILDNALGCAAVATLPFLLDQLGIKLKDNLVLLGTVRTLGKGDIAGMRFFLENNKLDIRAGLLCEGGSIGRLSYSSLGMIRGMINCTAPRTTGAIPIINRIVTQMLNIALPQEPITRMILGSVYAGTAYNSPPRDAHLRFELRSEGEGVVGEVYQQIEAIVSEVNAINGVTADVAQVARRTVSTLGFQHPLVVTARRVMKALEVEDHVAPSTGELGALITRGIPALTLGLTNGDHRHDYNEVIEIGPIFTGLAQIITLLQAIDGGLCDVED